MMLSQYEKIVTKRDSSIFAADVVGNRRQIEDCFKNSSVLVIGAAGSIGSSVLRKILQFRPARVVVSDINENGLVELNRDLRSNAEVAVPVDFELLPLGIGSLEFSQYFAASRAFDYVLNLSAVKHVRSEKNIYCLKRMIDTNVLFLDELISETKHPIKKMFSVSSDKAVNPANLMGASKNIMEQTLFRRPDTHPASTARFANVAFSNGSLLEGFLNRIAKRQAMAAPDDVQRYFISHEEAGDLCLLSIALGCSGDVFVPHPRLNLAEIKFSEIAIELLASQGFEAVVCQSESEAKARFNEFYRLKKWPCLFGSSDTTGEKQSEEFFDQADSVDSSSFKTVAVVNQKLSAEQCRTYDLFLEFVKSARLDSRISKEGYVKQISMLVPGLNHLEMNHFLDSKM